MQRHRPLVTALSLVTAGVVVMGVSSAVAVEPDQVPVTQGESITLWAGTVEAPMKLLANDFDPEGERLQVCRFGEPQPDWRLQVDPVDFTRGGRVLITLDPTAAGVYTYEYRACDHSYLVPETLTVDVQPVALTTVETVPDRPRMLRVTNPDQHSVHFLWFRHNTDDLLGYVEVDSGASQLVRAGATRIDWGSEFLDGNKDVLTGYGTIGGLTASRPPQSDRSLARVPSRFVDALERGRGDRSTDSATYDMADPTSVAPPLTQGDEVTWWAGAMGRVPVLANDSDPQGQHLDVCRVAGSGRAVSAWTQLDNTGFSVESRGDTSGTFTVTYYACNDARLAPGTVTVHLHRAKPVQVSAVRGGVRIANPNGERVRVQLDDNRWHPTWRTVRVPAHGARHLPLDWKLLSWFAQIGRPRGFAGSGRIDLNR